VSEMDGPKIMQLEVCNHNTFQIDDRFNGVPISLPVDQWVTIGPDEALHLFGYPGEPADMALHMAKRFGWSGRDYLIPEGTHQEAKYVTLARNIEIRPIYYRLIRDNPDDPIPADDGSQPDGGRSPVEAEDQTSTTKVGRRRKTAPRAGKRRITASQPRGREPARTR
jgi:hypothetical protein